MTGDEEAVLEATARVLETESEMVRIELVLRTVLPDLLDGMIAGLARAFRAEIIGLSHRIDQLERQR